MINDESFVEFGEGVRKGTLEIQKKCRTFTIFLASPVYFYLGNNLCVTVVFFFFFFLRKKWFFSF